MSTTVWCKCNFVGFHFWEKAPDEVSYLRSTHRHEFHVLVNVDVNHNDRQVEFHTLKAELKFLISRDLDMFRIETAKPYSCETIATLLQKALSAKYSVKSISVSEDGECGATRYAD